MCVNYFKASLTHIIFDRVLREKDVDKKHAVSSSIRGQSKLLCYLEENPRDGDLLSLIKNSLGGFTQFLVLDNFKMPLLRREALYPFMNISKFLCITLFYCDFWLIRLSLL